MDHVSLLSSARKTFLAVALSAVIALVPAHARAQGDPPMEAGRLSYVSGSVSVQPVGLDAWGQAEPNLPLGPGDRIFTDFNGRAEIQIGRTYVRVGPNSDVSIIDVTPLGISVGVAQGSVHAHCYALWPAQALHFNTPSGSATLRSPGELRVDVYPGEQAALFTQLADDAQLTGAGGFSTGIAAGSALELVGSNPVIPQWMQPAQFDALDLWSQQRDVQIADSISYRYVSPDIGGAYELDAYGQWNPNSPYGAIWFPNVQPGWAPYHYGHWVSHAPWGWTWVEEEPWGYAPFHYGRWVVFNGRWGWVPGPVSAHPVWSPALVVFAGGINVGGVGVSAWFPLGPGEPYRPWYPCSPHYIDQVNITNLTPTPTIHVRATYIGFNFGAVVFVNRTAGITAISQADFAAGRPVRQTNIVVNVNIVRNITIVDRPAVAPNPRIFASRPPARPVPVPVARPTLINEKGMVVSARPGFKPVAAPVRPAPQVHTLPGHRAAPPPAGANTAARPGGAPGAAARPGAKPGAPAHSTAAMPSRPTEQAPAQAKPAGKPAVTGSAAPNHGGQESHPGGAKPTESTAKPASGSTAQPAAKPAPKPESKPATEPGAKPGKPATAKPGQNGTGKPGAKPEDKNKAGEKNGEKKEKPADNNN